MKMTLKLMLAAMATAMLMAPAASAQSDYVSSAPATVYESSTMSPQNMDFDAANNMFKAHAGWLNDKLIHYYKFRMYTPDTYPSHIAMQGTPHIVIAPLYLLTTNGALSGLVADQKPILRHHHADGQSYSDFLEIHFVTVSGSHAANTYRSYGDLQAASMVPASGSGIYVNAPLVPTGSTLQAPSGTGTSPILPVMVWYRGVEVQLFFFETTSQPFADHFNPKTRSGSAGGAGSGFEMTVSPGMMNANKVRWEPIWHINQLFTGVTPGVNSGGPADMGQRNVIGVDRLDSTYSPLWQVWWITQVPPGYKADQASHPNQFTSANGFELMKTPMFVNCPNVGPHGGGSTNGQKASSFTKSPSVNRDASVTLEGALVMAGGQIVKAFVGAREVASATTGMMGGYALTIPGSELTGSTTVTVKDATGATVATYTLEGPSSPTTATPSLGLGAILLGLVLLVGLMSRRSR
jgi:hypothetical protein